ncbi:cytochrome P450 [Nitzschia inconspicua]|uniref:Cytochrome P450 n=1 Tax=Nitzschia inconspicua TaxID=303405 RepID=A0A9K3M761_9STRA|nr:cytochrome P450 [Nitzschia inconspicua]
MTSSTMETFVGEILSQPWRIVVALALACILNSLISWMTRPKNLPPFYAEYPYIPWLGSLVQFATGPREFLQRAAKAKGDCFTIQLFGKQMTFLMGTEGHAKFFKAPEKTFDIREAYKMTITTFGPGVCYDCPQSKMAQQFALFKDNLSHEKFVEYMSLIQEEVATFFEEQWGDEGEADLLASLSDLYTLTSSRCLLGPEIRKKWKSSGMGQQYLALDHSFVPILFFFPWIPNPNKAKCVTARKLFEKMFKEVIDERNKEKAKDPQNFVPPSDILQVLMEASYRDGTKLTLTEITGILLGVLLGGQHTSNVTSTWLMAHLLKDEKWMKAVMDEQDAIFRKKSESDRDGLYPSQLTYEEVQGMKIFDQVMCETLRLHPPFFQLSRAVMVESHFQKYTIPKGHIVNISPGAAHRLPQLWDEPDKFDPDRFTEEAKKEHKPYSWIPFGGGMHACGGRRFAWNSLKVSLTWLLRNYEIEFVGAGATTIPKEDYTTMVVSPTSKHCRIKYRRRTKK